jgi:dihydroorotate dehydrogenase electron transfer subunit
VRQAIFPVHVEPRGDAIFWSFLLPAGSSAGGGPAPLPASLSAEPAAAAFLHSLRPGESLNLLGPYGSGFQLDSRTRTLLLAADLQHAPLLFPLLEEALDQGARITLLLDAGAEPIDTRNGDDTTAQTLLSALPLAVEARLEAHDALPSAIAATAPWADQSCLALPMHDYAQVARLVRKVPLRPAPGALQALVDAPLPCGVGACLACVVPLSGGGHTRACVHGPVMDLLRIA